MPLKGQAEMLRLLDLESLILVWACGVKFFVTFLGVLVATAYCTLLERKLLAGAQRRKGPNKIS